MADLARGSEFVDGAVDLYVHGEPDLIPRLGNDLELGAELRDAGYAAAVHRHHFSGTSERCTLVAAATGFPLLGAILLDDCAGALNPSVVERELRMGAVWVGLPTISSSFFRSRLAGMRPEVRAMLDVGRDVPVVDDDGRVLEAVVDILDLAREHGAVVAAGYLRSDEVFAVVRAAIDRGVRAIVLSNPLSPAMRLPLEDIRAVMDLDPRVHLEISVYQSGHPAVPPADPPVTMADAAALIRSVGVERSLVSSDGGIAGAPNPPEILAWGGAALLDEGLSADEVSRVVRANPAALLGLS